MAKLKISKELAEQFMQARLIQGEHSRKIERRKLMKLVHAEFPALSTRIKFKIAVENPNNPLHRIVRDKHTGVPFDDGQPEPLSLEAPMVSTATDVVVKAKSVKSAPAKKVAAAKAPAKKVVKAPVKAKPAPAKAVKSKSAPVAKAKPVKASAKPVAKAKAKAK